jgi:hypothetical protein
MTTRPDISVVVPSLNGLPYPMECLDALAAQQGDLDVEVIVPDCTGAAVRDAIAARFPRVRVLPFDGQRSVPFLRAAGVAAATARYVAVTEDHCVPRADWCAQLVRGLERTGWAAIGGGVENGRRVRTVDWAVYFCEYHTLINPVPAGPATGIPGMNVAYDTERMGELRALFADEPWENVLHDRIRAAGYEIGLDPAIVVEHCKDFTVPMFLRERFHYSRAFAGNRVEGARWSTRAAWAAATFLLPFLLVARITAAVFGRKRHRGWLVRALPLILLFSVMWSIGECAGYLTGPGDSLVRVR